MLNKMCLDCMRRCDDYCCEGATSEVWTGCAMKKAVEKGQIWKREDGKAALKIIRVAAMANNPEIIDITYLYLEDGIVSHMRIEWLTAHYDLQG